MPQLGETVTEGTVTRWLKQVGEQVAPDELIFEVSTDKVDSEVPSPSGGFLSEILVPEGETVPVGTRLAVLTDSPPGEASGGGDSARATEEAPAEKSEAAPEPAPAPKAEAEAASPPPEAEASAPRRRVSLPPRQKRSPPPRQKRSRPRGKSGTRPRGTAPSPPPSRRRSRPWPATATAARPGCSCPRSCAV